MRIRDLLFTLFILVASTPAHASLGVAPQCVPSTPDVPATTAEVKSPLPQLPRVISSYDPEDRDYLIRTIAFEAGEEPDEGKAAVAHVVLNRTKSGRWGDTIKDVVTRPWQFEPWMTRRKEIGRLLQMILATRTPHGLPMPFFPGRCRIRPRVRRTSSIPRSFGRDAAALYRHGRRVRGSRSANTPFTHRMAVFPRWSSQQSCWIR